MHRINKNALVLFSGGQDSTLCLVMALTKYAHVETIGFEYGQRHMVEMICRKTIRDKLKDEFADWAAHLGEDHILSLTALTQISKSALTQQRQIEMTKEGLPNTFVPGRNLLFFTYAAALAYRRNIDVLVGGMCETDYSGYPDCRDETLTHLATSLQLGMDREIEIETPLMWQTKAQTWTLADQIGGERLVKLLREETHSCYLGERVTLYPWGYGCNGCPACDLRREGFAQWQQQAARSHESKTNR